MACFHQDWIHDGDTAAEVVAKHLGEWQDEEALAVRRDARALDGLPSSTLELLWYACTQYMANFERLGGGAEWMRTVIGLCDARLSVNTVVHALTGADVEDGITCLDAVLAEIESARFLTAEVRSALTICARHSTPDVAFRLLLRAARCAPEAPLSSEQYARLEAIGSAMRYGEFLVDSVRYLVQ
jgi:hypothetical protein